MRDAALLYLTAPLYNYLEPFNFTTTITSTHHTPHLKHTFNRQHGVRYKADPKTVKPRLTVFSCSTSTCRPRLTWPPVVRIMQEPPTKKDSKMRPRPTLLRVHPHRRTVGETGDVVAGDVLAVARSEKGGSWPRRKASQVETP